ncbi:hypothetical protein ACIQZG_04375 [Lysinibacillus sp. NPDC096418]|uniref:hypothetical protein n=1 Tax=Lysinibacillus sp. NPDC096418 TaxID=3364138 RepID=UPI00382110C4
MANNLIENETKVFYTVRIKDGLFVKHAEMYRGRIESTKTTREEDSAEVFANELIASEVASYVDGTVTKHTRTTIVTEITEDVVPKGDAK